MRAPVCRWGWFCHYTDRYVKTSSFDALHLAIWYQLLHLEHDEDC